MSQEIVYRDILASLANDRSFEYLRKIMNSEHVEIALTGQLGYADVRQTRQTSVIWIKDNDIGFRICKKIKIKKND